MYAPKIRDELIHRLYHLAKSRGIPMTHLVNELLEQGLQKIERGAEGVSDAPSDYQPTNPAKRDKGGDK